MIPASAVIAMLVVAWVFAAMRPEWGEKIILILCLIIICWGFAAHVIA